MDRALLNVVISSLDFIKEHGTIPEPCNTRVKGIWARHGRVHGELCRTAVRNHTHKLGVTLTQINRACDAVERLESLSDTKSHMVVHPSRSGVVIEELPEEPHHTDQSAEPQDFISMLVQEGANEAQSLREENQSLRDEMRAATAHITTLIDECRKVAALAAEERQLRQQAEAKAQQEERKRKEEQRLRQEAEAKAQQEERKRREAEAKIEEHKKFQEDILKYNKIWLKFLYTQPKPVAP